MNLRYRPAIILFLVAYIIITILAYGISYAAAEMFSLPSYQELGLTLFEDPAFVMTVPYHLLINLVIWTLFAYLYIKKSMQHGLILKESVNLGLFWLILAMIVDVIAFVLIKSPYSLTARQFYIEYQPWITITYLLVILGPLLAGWVNVKVRLRTR